MHKPYAPANFRKHASLRWSRPDTYRFAADWQITRIALSEVKQAAHYFPLCIRKTAVGFELVAVLADPTGQNRYVAPDGTWSAPYVPFYLRTYPFSLVRAAGRKDLLLAVARDESFVNDSADFPLFEPSGAFTAATAAMHEALLKAQAEAAQLSAACAQLHALSTTAELPRPQWGPAIRRLGLRVVLDEELAALARTDPARLAELHRADALALELAVILAFSQRRALAESCRATRRTQPGAEARPGDVLLDYGVTLAFDR